MALTDTTATSRRGNDRVNDSAVKPAKGREPQPESYSAAGLTLRAAGGIFLRTFSARLITPLVAAVVAVRIAVAGWSWGDLVAAGAICLAQPFTEWIIHVTLLHWRPRQLGPVTIDPLGARRHRQHHRNPKIIGLVLVPRPVLLSTIVGVGLVAWLAAPTWRIALTAAMTSYSILLTYEWTHFLIHSSYKPRGRYYRSIYRAHRLHHFRNENFWYGVTINVGDYVLRTFPDKDAVPISPTAATLGIDG